MQRVFDVVRKVADTDLTVLVRGPSGTGKELVANAIHYNSPRRKQAFIKVNCAAVSRELVESELFGHEKGAFTGAVATREGKFEAAHGGTLFLDEVGDMPLETQAKILRALQEREIERVGGNRTIRVDVRVLAATNQDLDAKAKRGEFREDLYYRLNVVPITLPPLRHRREDIPLLVQHFVRQCCEANGLAVKTISQTALRALMSYTWPGNIRQLENAIEHAVAMSARSPEIPAQALPGDLHVDQEPAANASDIAIPEEGLSFTSVVSQLERDLILRCLERTGGNKRQAARLLQLSRTTFIDKMQRLNIESHPAA